MLRWLIAILALVTLGGCTMDSQDASQAQQTRMSGALDGWVGQSVAAYVAEHGDPTSSVRLDNISSAFRWVILGSGAGAVVPVGQTMMVIPPRQLQCAVIFTGTTSVAKPDYKDFTITGYRWEGNC